MPLDIVTSPANPLLKGVRRAQERGGLTPEGWLVAEGPRLVEEAVRSGMKLRCLITNEATAIPPGVEAERVISVPDKVFRSISGTDTPQGILALAEPPAFLTGDLFRGVPLIVVLDGVQDPGNAGTIARAAEAFGATGLLFLKGAAHPFHPKTLRASAGSLFRLPLIRGLVPNEARDLLRERVRVFAGVPSREKVAPIWDCDLTPPCAIVIGSEGQGISPEWIEHTQLVAIPTQSVESLNAASAASVLLYEAMRQRYSRVRS